MHRNLVKKGEKEKIWSNLSILGVLRDFPNLSGEKGFRDKVKKRGQIVIPVVGTIRALAPLESVT